MLQSANSVYCALTFRRPKFEDEEHTKHEANAETKCLNPTSTEHTKYIEADSIKILSKPK